MQIYINYYPQSERLDQCNELIDQLRYKLQRKDYEIGFLYYKTSNYQASVTTFNNILKDYPDTKFKEDILYYIVKANYYYAFHSIELKLLERYTETTISYKVFVKAFPESKYSKELNHLYENSEKQLKAIEDNKKI